MKSGIYNCLIIVTRYFGGTLLGTGGLIRAYQAASKEGLEHSTVLSVSDGVLAQIDADYNSIGKIQYICLEMHIDILKTEVELNCELRDKLATLKWQLLATQPIFQRYNVPEGYIYDFQKEIVEKCNYGYGFSLEDAISESFHDKNITSEEEVFSFLENLDININNAFLLRGHSKKLKK